MKKSIQILLILLFSTIGLPALAEDEDAEPLAAIYYKIPEPFTINFLTQSANKARYLQIKVTLMAHDEDTIGHAEMNLPMLEDALRSIFSEQSFEAVNSVAGRKALQISSLDALNTILKEETGKDNLDAVYFTSFILQ